MKMRIWNLVIVACLVLSLGATGAASSATPPPPPVPPTSQGQAGTPSLTPAPYSPPHREEQGTTPDYLAYYDRIVQPGLRLPDRAFKGGQSDALPEFQVGPDFRLPTTAGSLSPASITATPVITFYVSTGIVEGFTTPNSSVYASLWRSAVLAGEARFNSDDLGYVKMDLVKDGRRVIGQPGDQLNVSVGGGTNILQAPNLAATVNPVTDMLTGQITGVSLPAQLLVDVWGNQSTITTDALGQFSANLSGLMDISWVTAFIVGHRDSNGNWTVTDVRPQNGMAINLRDPSVQGFTQPGATVTVSVDHGGTISTQTVTADLIDGWWGAFFTVIDPGDLVTAEVGGGTIAANADTLNFTINTDTDHVTGIAPPNSQVNVLSAQHRGLVSYAASRVVSTDVSGAFDADFSSEGLDNQHWAGVYYHTTPQADTFTWLPPYQVQVELPWNNIWGNAQPATTITATLQGGPPQHNTLEVQHSITEAGYGYYSFAFDNAYQPGYRVLVEGAGLDETIDLLSVQTVPDVNADVYRASVPPNATIFVELNSNTDTKYNDYYNDFATADPSGDIAISFNDILDVHNGAMTYAYLPNGNDIDQPGWQYSYGFAPFINMNETHNGIYGRLPFADTPVTFELRSSTNTLIATADATSNQVGEFGWIQFYDSVDNVIDIQPGDYVTVSAGDWSQSVYTLNPAPSATVDADSDTVSGVGPANSYVEVRSRDYWPPLIVPTDGSGNFIADFSSMLDIVGGMGFEIAQFDPNWNRAYVYVAAPFARANLAWDGVDGWFGAGVDVSYEVRDEHGALKGGGNGSTNPDGWLNGIWCNCNLLPGDQVTIQSSAGFDAQLMMLDIHGHINIASDTVSGTMSGASFPASGDVGTWNRGAMQWSWTGIEIQDDGTFLADFGEIGYDLITGEEAEVWYHESDGNRIGTSLFTLNIEANYAHDWVFGYTEPDTPVTVEVVGKSTFHGQSNSNGNFQTGDWPSSAWSNGWPDIQVGDVVNVTAAGFSKNVNPIGAINTSANQFTEIVTASLATPWLTQDVLVGCGIWWWNGPGMEFMTDPASPFSCNFADLGWNIVPGQDIAVWYQEPDGDRVFNIIQPVYARANSDWDSVDGWFGPDVTVNYVVRDSGNAVKGGGSGQAYPSGWMDGVWCNCDLIPGDKIDLTTSAGYTTQMVIANITAHFNPAADTITGQVSGASFSNLAIADLWNHARQRGTYWPFDLPVSGLYTADLSGVFDLQQGDWGNLWYLDLYGNLVGREMFGLRIEVDYMDEWLAIQTEPNTPLTIQVRDGVTHNTKATLSSSSDPNGRFKGWEHMDLWSPDIPDIAPGDEVTVSAAGFTATVDPVGTIDVYVDYQQDIVQGNIHAPWFTGDLWVTCVVWVDYGPGIDLQTAADGGGYLCDFKQVGWDLQPGFTVAVYYTEPDNDNVIKSYYQEFYQTYLPLLKR